MLVNLQISTTHLTLRPVRPTDRADLMALESDPEVMRYLNGGQVVPEAGHINADFLTPRGEEREVVAAHHKESGAFVGWFALFDDGVVDGLRTAEIGYRLVKSAWGKGYGTEGVRALLDVAFNSMGIDRVRAETMAVNQASRRVLEKAGFRHAKTAFPKRTVLVAGAERGDVIYEVCKVSGKTTHVQQRSGYPTADGGG